MNLLSIEILMNVYSILCVFAPCTVYLIIAYRRSQEPDGAFPLAQIVWRYIFILYLYTVMKVVGIGNIWDIGKYGSVMRFDEINLIPFQSVGATTYILNIIMFLPLGFLLPLIWKKYGNLGRTVLIGFIFSLSIELGQLFNRRATDIDDIMMNTFGTLFGFVLCFLFTKLIKKFFILINKSTENKKNSAIKIDDNPMIYILSAVLGTFLLHNWRWLLAIIM